MCRSHPASTTRRDLRAMLIDGVFFSVMVGIGETYLPAFVLAVGLQPIAAGLITSIPLLAGAMLQLLSPAAVRWLGSHRRWVVFCASVQAAAFLPLCIAALNGYISTLAVFMVATVYWGFGTAAGPAWNTWAEAIVPRPLRARYFGWRTRFTQAGVLFGFVSGGLALHFTHGTPYQMTIFAAMFFIAAACRFVSARYLSSQSETLPLSNEHRNVSVGELLRRFHKGGSERLLLYLASVQFAVYLAGPYFNPYMLKHMNLSSHYGTYMALVATSFVAKMIALPALGSMAHRFGAQRLLWIGGIGIVPLSGMWLVSNSLPFLIALQFLGGIVWAAYELAMLLLFFETIRREERTSVLTLFNVANAMAMVLGSLVSGALLRVMGEFPQSYLAIFVLSSVARLCTVVLLVRLPSFRFETVPIGLRTVEMRPDGTMDRPILPSLPDEMPGQAPQAVRESSVAPT